MLAEDMHMVRGALVALLKLEPDFEVIAEVESGDAILPVALERRPDVIIVDLDLPGLDGLTAATQLRNRIPECGVLILTSLDRPGTLRRALAAGALGYLRKDAPSQELAEAVRKVAAHELAVDRQLMHAAWSQEDNPLTSRETEVLRWAASGAETTEIAAQVHLSVGTVRNYLTSAVAKLNARNRLDAVRIASEAGWL
ncbi:DNA-binding response regulator [Streptomyces sp. NPDC001796]|uniref:response regulator transcription factor n=1 Tax=Streptomyces sp. NPDC001796 TaxID=3364609 RepID=UPI0036D16697